LTKYPYKFSQLVAGSLGAHDAGGHVQLEPNDQHPS
jgi:hypothetical protein